VLRSLKLEQFKAFARTNVPLRPFTVLIGTNGAGKTTILQAIELFGRLVTGTVTELLEAKGWEYSDLPHLRSRTNKFTLSADLELEAKSLIWQLTLGAGRRPGVSDERVSTIPSEDADADREHVRMDRVGRTMKRITATGEVERVTQTLTSSWLSTIDERDRSRFPELHAIAMWARRIRGYFFLDPLKLRAPSRGDGNEIGVNGETLAPFLARLRDRDRPAFERVQSRVQRHYPKLVELHPVRGRYGWTHLEITERWNGEQARFSARQVSDGLLRLVAVAAMHELSQRPSVLLLDEVENGLHPHLLGGLVKMLQELVHSGGGTTQVIIATHSPITVNYCESADDVLIVTRGRGGHPQARPLSSTRGFQRLGPHFDLGELWYNVGEKDLLR
jgi:predicted ATPase